MTIHGTTIKGAQVSDAHLTTAFQQMPKAGFSKAAFANALVKQGLTAGRDGDFIRRLMQHLKQSGLIDFDAVTKNWQLTDLGRLRTGKTLQMTHPIPSSPNLSHRFAETARLTMSALACFALITALITLNASFAWELGREAAQFQMALVAGLMALDLMRPFLVAAGFRLAAQNRLGRAALGFLVAFALAPVSVLSSTAILSSSFLLGAELIANDATKATTLETLRGEHARLLDEAERSQTAWVVECTRGGCGPIAADLEAEFKSTTAKAQDALDQIVGLTEAGNNASKLIARMVETFEQLGLFGNDRQIWLPLFLALSLELGALFGPALLLTRSKP